MKLNKSFYCLLVVGLFGAVFGCRPEDIRKFEEILKKKMPEPKRIITVNSIVKYPRAKELEKEIPTFTGRTIWVNTNSFIHSKSVQDIELIPRDPEGHFYDLKLKLNNHGRLIWMQLSAGYSYQKLAFVVDGMFYRSFIPKPLIQKEKDGEEESYAIIEGPFDKYTADEIKKYATSNYAFFNQE